MNTKISFRGVQINERYKRYSASNIDLFSSRETGIVEDKTRLNKLLHLTPNNVEHGCIIKPDDLVHIETTNNQEILIAPKGRFAVIAKTESENGRKLVKTLCVGEGGFEFYPEAKELLSKCYEHLKKITEQIKTIK